MIPDSQNNRPGPAAHWPAGNYGIPAERIEPSHFEEVAGFAERDRLAPPPANAVLFIGSSTIRIWDETLHAAMAPLPCIARGFGGAKTWDCLYFFDAIVRPYKPALMVFFAGTNDLNSREAEPPETITNTERFLDMTRTACGDIPVLYMAITRTPETREIWPLMDSVSRHMERLAAGRANLHFFQTNDYVVEANGEPGLQYFQEDRHHLSQAGYDRIAPALKARIEALLPAGG